VKIFVFEFFSGGGGASREVSNSILSEGYAMLNSITSDFSKTGNEIITTLDYRIKRFNPPLDADEIIDISNEDDFNSKFDQILTRDIDAAFLIAPETDEILYELARQVEKQGITLLGPSSSSIKLTTDKHETNKKVKKLTRIPRSEALPIDAPPNVIFQASKKVGLPFVMKPLDGVACSVISLIKDEQEIPNGLKKIKSESAKDHFMIQEYIKGVDASLSLLIGQNRVFPLTLNFQNVDLKTSTYLGGYTPFDHPLKEKTIERSIKIVR
jgi:predicted ATP-grasp superfamily ATP-dependent carboligase